MNWMILPFRRYAEFSGRSRRMEYWMFTLLNVIVSIALFLLIMATAGAGEMLNEQGEFDLGFGAMFGGLGLLLLLWFLAVLIPSIAVTVRRLHDRDMSGWWYLGFIVASMIPIVGFLATIAFIVVMLLPGTPGANRFGPDPKDPHSVEVFA